MISADRVAPGALRRPRSAGRAGGFFHSGNAFSTASMRHFFDIASLPVHSGGPGRRGAPVNFFTRAVRSRPAAPAKKKRAPGWQSRL